MERNKRKLEEDDDNNDQSNEMESKKRKLEEDDHNNDQLNPVVISEVGSGSRADEDTGVEQQQLVVASNQALPYPGFDPVFNRALLMYQWQPYSGSLNQPASSSNPTFNQVQQPRRSSLNQPRSSPMHNFDRVPLDQFQPPRGSLNQPRSSSKATVNRPQLHQSQPRHGSLNQPRSSPMPMFDRVSLDQLQPPRDSLNQPRSRSKAAVNRSQWHQLQPRRGSWNQPRSSSKAAVNRSQLHHQLQPRRGSLNQPIRSSSKPLFDRVQLHELQPHRVSLNQPRSSSKPAVNQPSLLQLLPSGGSLNEPGSSSTPGGSLNEPGSSSTPGLNRVPLHEFQPPWSNEAQQNPLPPSRSTQEPDLQLTLMTSQQSSSSRIWAGLVNHLSANIRSLNTELYAMEQTVGAANVLPAGVFQDGDYRSQLQGINGELYLMQTRMRELRENMTMSFPSVDPMPSIVSSHQGGGSTSSNVLFSRAQDDKNKGHSDDAKLPFVLLDQGARSGPGSTSGNVTAGGESEGPVNTAAGDTDEKQGEEENADTSQDGNTRGDSSAP